MASKLGVALSALGHQLRMDAVYSQVKLLADTCWTDDFSSKLYLIRWLNEQLTVHMVSAERGETVVALELCDGTILWPARSRCFQFFKLTAITGTGSDCALWTYPDGRISHRWRLLSRLQRSCTTHRDDALSAIRRVCAVYDHDRQLLLDRLAVLERRLQQDSTERAQTLPTSTRSPLPATEPLASALALRSGQSIVHSDEFHDAELARLRARNRLLERRVVEDSESSLDCLTRMGRHLRETSALFNELATLSKCVHSSTQS
jgi:hypothetical protein